MSNELTPEQIDLQERREAFTKDYNELVKKYRITFMPKLNFTTSGITAIVNLADITPPQEDKE